MKWAMTTVSYRYHLYSFADLMDIAKRCGFRCIELWEPHFNRNQTEIFSYVEQTTEHLPIDVCSAYLDLTDFSERSIHWAEQAYAKLLNCRRLGIGVLRLFTGQMPFKQANLDDWQRWFERLDKLNSFAKQLNIHIAFENHPGTLLDCVEGVEKLVNEINNNAWQYIGLNFDAFHVWEYGVDTLAYLKRWYPHIKHVHLKNASKKTQQFAMGNVYHPMGKFDEICPTLSGVVDIAPLVMELNQLRYQGAVTLEHFGEPSIKYFNREIEHLQSICRKFPFAEYNVEPA